MLLRRLVVLKDHSSILLLLRTPPPFGGGEIRAAALRDHVFDLEDFCVRATSSKFRNKATQGRLSLWSVLEFVRVWVGIIWAIIKHRPALIYLPLAKSFPHFVRDSVLVWTANLLRVKVACDLPGATFYFLGKGRCRTWYGRLVLSHCACIRVLGKGIARNLEKFGVTNTIVNDNGIEFKELGTTRMRPIDGVSRFLFVGTLSPQKGFDQLVIACVRLAQMKLKFEIHAMGEWVSEEFRVQTMKTLRENSITYLFSFHGLLHGTEKWQVFSSSQVFVLPSMQEGQPLSVLEALAIGLPIVTSRVGAIEETIEHRKNGFLIVAGDVCGLTAALADSISDCDMREAFSVANRELFKRRFTKDTYLRTQVSWLRACAEGRLHPQGQTWTCLE